MKLSPTQEEIVNINGNLIVKASAGTGKTHTMVAKIAHDIKNNKNHQVIAAITFTIKAASEIKERLTIDPDRHFIGTNNSFAIEEIIKPFMRDVYGQEYDKDITTDYSIKVKDFAEGLFYIKEKEILCSYKNNKENFIFQLAYDILTRSKVCQEYLKARYFKVYIDEYQDCDKDMHKLFMYICDNLKIDTFVVGDEKQSIYIWRGAYPKAFLSIWEKENFSKRFMGDNFRSCQQIQNYSNLLFDETCNLYNPTKELDSIILLNVNEKSWDEYVSEMWDGESSIAILRFSNDNAEKAAFEMQKQGVEMVYVPATPISEVTTNVAWLYMSLAKYFIINTYSVFDIMQVIPEESVGNKKIKGYLQNELALLDKCLKEDNLFNFQKEVEKIAGFFNYETKPDHIEKLYITIKNEKYHAAFNIDMLKNVSITFHSSKGLEYDLVVIFAEDYRLADETSIYNHYVAVTRAKSKLIIVYNSDWNAQKYVENLSSLLKKRNLKLTDIVTIV